jgi:dTDP-glucose 4,6-dehydratase
MTAPSTASILSGKRVLVTGATGFIGRHLCRALTGAGAGVTVLCRPGAVLPPFEDPKGACERIEGDLRDADRLRAVVPAVGASHVFHLAAATSVARGFQTAQDMIQTNVQGTVNLLEALEHTPYTCFIHTGSAEEYGAGAAPFQETAPLMPVSAYSASKAAATLFCEMYHRTMNCPVVILRPFLVYGPGQPPTRLIPQAILAALANRPFPMTTGRQTREFTYIDDLIEGFLAAAVTPEAVGQIINLGTGQPYTVLEVVHLIQKLTGRSMPLHIGALPTRPGEIMQYVCDNAKARTLLGWTPGVSLEEGLERTIAWYRQHPPEGMAS